MITVEEADEIMGSKLNKEAWIEASDASKTLALKQAEEIVDSLNFIGDLTSSTQEHQFPRDAETTVPDDIKKALTYIAYALLDGIDPEIELSNLDITQATLGSVKSSYDRASKAAHILAGVPSVVAWRYLLPYLRQPGKLKLERLS